MSLVQVVAKNLTVAGLTQTTSAIATTPGNTLLFFAAYNATSAGTVTPSDSTTQVWTRVPNAPFAGTATGLTLDVWIARNIAGNAANTFTFATTGNDTPTMFVAELGGRDKSNPLDLTVTASDSAASSGAHTTGAIAPNASHDDLLAFTVATATGQGFTAGGAWSIPPNGTVVTSPGYDAFVQYQNGVGLGSVANAYSVTASDKLDAFLIALQIPGQPYGDEYHDQFNEVPEVFPIGNAYQQRDVEPQIADVDVDWLAEAAEDDAWIGTEDQSGPVGANVFPNIVAQYYGEDSELFDEVLEPTLIPTSRQQTDLAQKFDDPWDWDEDPDDFFADDFGNDDADPPVDDPWDWTQGDDVVLIVGSYRQSDAIGPTPITIEDAWEPTFFAEEPDQIDGTTTDLDAVGPDNNPIIAAADSFETVFDDLAESTDDSWWSALAGDYAYVDVVTNAAITVEDGWDHWSQDPDDENFLVLDTDSVTVNTTPGPEDAWDWSVVDDDDYVIPDDYFQPPDQLAIEDAFDYTQDADEETFFVLDSDPVSTPQPPCPDEAWDWTQDADDESFQVLDTDPVAAPQPQCPEDAFDTTQDADDDEWITRDTDPVGLDAPIILDEAWDWTQDDVDDLAGMLNEQLVADVITAPAQFTDFAWEWDVDDQLDYWVDQEILILSQASTVEPRYLLEAQQQIRRITSVTPRIQMLTGPQPYAEYFMRVGDRNVFGIDWSQWLANAWIAGELVALGFTIRPAIPNGFQYICTVAGESANTEPAWPTVVGATIADGSVVWMCADVDNTSLVSTLISALWTATAGISINSPTTIGQIAQTILDVSAAVAGTDYVVNCAATMSDGEVKTGQLKLKVR